MILIFAVLRNVGRFYREAVIFSRCQLWLQTKISNGFYTLQKNNPEYIFAISGGGNLKNVAESSGFSGLPNVYFLGYVSDNEAKCLIKNCRAFIFPSLYEGFGLPPLEAMGIGCKNIIVSDIEVMHEIYGDKVNYIDPENFDGSINFSEFRANSYDEILNKYSWEKSAQLLYNLANRLLKDGLYSKS